MLVKKASGDLDHKANELKKCGKIKTILMITVVLYHSMLCSAGVTWGPQAACQTSGALYYIAKYLNSVHIYAFTFVSGYVYAFLRYETDRYSDWKKVIEKKVHRLLLPYASAAIFWAIPFYCFFWKTNLKELTDKFLLGVSPNQLWFLLMLFWQFVIFQILSKRITTERKNIVCFFLLFLFCFYFGTALSMLKVPNFFQLKTALIYFLFFYLGIVFRRTDTRRYVTWRVFWGGTFLSILLFICGQILHTQSFLLKAIAIALSPFVSIFGTYSVVIGCLMMSRKASNQTESVMQKGGMTVYLFHQQLIYISICLFNKPWMSPLVLTLLNFAVGLLGGTAIYLILRKWKITRFLFAIEK